MTTTMDQATWDSAPEGAEQRHEPTSAHDAHGAQDARLVARLRAGDAEAIDELYRAYRKPVFGFLVRLVRDRHAAEDLFQNTWLKVSRSAARLREDTELKAWLFTIARNEFRSYRRWQLIDISRVFLFYRERGEPPQEPAEDSAEGVALAGTERALAALGASDREVLLLVCVEGMDPQQAAEVLGISHAALRQRLGRARARLKDLLSKLESAGAERQARVRTR